ncbi:MAG: hypothetical protein LBG59_09430 [Candidatus Peribacteria bacterium]|nr:hypothetical protein [Candidatus Peribacteria bacterium]
MTVSSSVCSEENFILLGISVNSDCFMFSSIFVESKVIILESGKFDAIAAICFAIHLSIDDICITISCVLSETSVIF